MSEEAELVSRIRRTTADLNTLLSAAAGRGLLVGVDLVDGRVNTVAGSEHYPKIVARVSRRLL